jgi:transposase
MGQHRHVQLSENERTELEQLIRSGVHSARVIGRARILLLADRSQGQKNTISQVAQAAMVTNGTVSNVKERYFENGLPGALYDKPRPGAVPKVTGEVEAQLIALACSQPPEGRGRWTLRLLAEHLVALEVVESISHVAVRDALKKTNLSLGG